MGTFGHIKLRELPWHNVTPIREDPPKIPQNTHKKIKRDNYIKRCPCTLNENTLNNFIGF
jgi:hypothetical protein